jgi:hypothetical protein
MRRFAIFATALFVLVVIGSQPRSAGGSIRSMCVCMASKAALIMKSITGTSTNASAQAPSAARSSDVAVAAR